MQKIRNYPQILEPKENNELVISDSEVKPNKITVIDFLKITIAWEEENNKYYGLDYSYLKGKWNDFTFDIRYDYEGDSTVKPLNCGMWLTIYFRKNRLQSTFSRDLNQLKNISVNFLKEIQQQFIKVNV